MDAVFGGLFILVMLVGVFALAASFRTGMIKRREKDEQAGALTRRHPVLFNPIFISYVLFPIVIVIGAYFFYQIYFRP